jgi:hypothetical protein
MRNVNSLYDFIRPGVLAAKVNSLSNDGYDACKNLRHSTTYTRKALGTVARNAGVPVKMALALVEQAGADCDCRVIARGL